MAGEREGWPDADCFLDSGSKIDERGQRWDRCCTPVAAGKMTVESEDWVMGIGFGFGIDCVVVGHIVNGTAWDC